MHKHSPNINLQQRNKSLKMDQLLKPFHNHKILSYPEKDRFSTSTSIQFKDLGHQQRIENIQLQKDDIRHTRRIMELSNNQSISHAVNVTKSIGCKKDAIARLKTYVGQAHDTLKNTQFEWTPCRYKTHGWKYQEKGTYQKHLNHPFKINTTGGFGPNQSIDMLK